MSLDTYKKLEAIVLPELVLYKNDLKVHDKDLLKNYNGKFLYAYRPEGTNIFKLDEEIVKNYDFKKSQKKLEDLLFQQFQWLKGYNKNYLFYDGENINTITHEELCTIFQGFCKRVYARKELIDKLNIPLIAMDLYWLMKDNKRKWKNIAIESTTDTFRRFRNRFNYEKIKWSDDVMNLENKLMENVL